MARSPDDATRFTATGPYAFNKASNSTAPSIGTRIDFGQAPNNESPQQKIARLRAAAQLARRPKEDRFDRVVRVGRRWADRAHRVTAYSLLGLTVVSVVVASAGITDLVLHNRARRRDWYKEQELKRKAEIDSAQTALSVGTITQDQMLLLAQERAKQDAAEARRNRPGMIKRTTNYLFGGLAKDEQKDGRLGAAAAAATATADKAKETFSAAKASMAEQLDNNAAESMVNIPGDDGVRAEVIPTGGLLDREAQRLANVATQQSRTWRQWLTRS